MTMTADVLETVVCTCGAPAAPHERERRAKDEVTGQVFTYRRCASCGVERCSPRPLPQAIGGYYPDSYAAHAVRGDSWVQRFKETVYRVFWDDRAPPPSAWTRLLRVLLYPMRGRSLLAFRAPALRRVFEFGAASGNNLVVFRAAGWQTEGCEPSPKACADAVARGLAVGCGTAEQAELPAGRYGCILINHVLEHVHDPVRVLSKCFNALADDGVLVVALPNHAGFAASWFGTAWPGYDAPRHLWGFTAPALLQLMRDQGFQIDNLYHEAAGRWSWKSTMEGWRSPDPLPEWRRRHAMTLATLLWPLGALAATVGHGDFIKVVARRPLRLTA